MNKKCFILLFWLLLWQGASMAIGNSIIFVGPAAVAGSLFTQAATLDFWKTIFLSFSKITTGFLAAFAAGILTGSLAYRFPLFQDFLAPIILLMKSIPVASFVILALIWMGSSRLSIFIGFMVVYPMIYTSTISGLKSTDDKLLEMCQVFQVPILKKIKYIYRPALMPYLISSCSTAIGMGIKSGIAAEVIGVPGLSIGEQLYFSKIYLDTASLFAWTLVIIMVTALFEQLFLYAMKKAS